MGCSLLAQYREGAITLPISSLVSEHKPELNLTQDIKENGLRYPVTCWELLKDRYNNNEYVPFDTVVRLDRLLNRTEHLYSQFFDDGRLIKDIYIVKAGNNRVAAALNLGYTSIDCLVYDAFIPGGWEDMVAGMRQCQGDS